MTMPKTQVLVRMYRPGHGDCFLLGFPRKGGGKPVYVMIDCGFKPGSAEFIHTEDISDIVAHIGATTGRRLDLVVLTHEHQDHLNGIWRKKDPYFAGFEIREAWMAWTEDPDDVLANQLRKRHHDQLLGLVAARNRLALAVGGNDRAVQRVDSLLALEFGGDVDGATAAAMLAATEDPSKSVNKQALKFIKDEASKHRGVSYLNPGQGPLTIPGTDGIRAYVLGPPRDPDLLADEDPKGSEAFPDDDAHGITFAAAATTGPALCSPPFTSRFCTPLAEALEARFLEQHYGKAGQGESDEDAIEVPSNAPWRRIDAEWLYSAENLALKLNTGINNTSVVLAIELPKSKKVLLLAADAQRGNWKSWAELTWKDGSATVTTRDLLGRTVLYKVGHHGSHNATLKGTTADDYANLGWMATGPAAAAEFTAMITAVNQWAMTKNDPPWRHPLPSIRAALLQKAQGRVFQTDIDRPEQPDGVPDGTWKKFTARSDFQTLYFDYTVTDE
jgi:hypothetical protein